MSDWYYRIGERVYGPYAETDLRGRIKSGKIPSNVSVSRNGFGDWQEANVSLFETERPPPKTPKPKKPSGPTMGQKLAGLFKRSRKPSSVRTTPWTRSRKRLLSWCIGIVVVGAIACVFVKIVGRHTVKAWAERLMTVFQSKDTTHYTLEKTRNYWVEMQQIEKNTKEKLAKMPEDKNPFNADGQAEMADFAAKDFEKFKDDQFKRAKIARDCIDRLERLPVYGVDPALRHYELEVRELWLLVERACLEFAEIAIDKGEQQACFASPEGYAQRFGTNSPGSSEMEYRSHKSQEQITAKIKKLAALSDDGTLVQASLDSREQEVEALLTARYGWKFQ